MSEPTIKERSYAPLSRAQRRKITHDHAYRAGRKQDRRRRLRALIGPTAGRWTP